MPTFIQKQNSSDPAVPSSLNDTTLNEIAVQSSFGALTTGVEYSFAAIYEPPGTGGIGTLTLAIRPDGGRITTDRYSISGAGSGANWSGNETLSVAVTDNNANSIGGLSTTTGIFNSSSVSGFSGNVDRSFYWNDMGTVANPLTVTNQSGDEISFQLTLEGLITGATYALVRDTSLPLSEARIEVDRVTASGPTATLTDDGDPHPLPSPCAFYRVEEQP